MGTFHKRILMVEDQLDTLVVARALRAYGYDVATAGTKAEGLQRCHYDFDLLVCDDRLPDGNGLDLLREAKRFSSIKGIAMTSSGTDTQSSRSAGYEAQLTKPVEFGVLLHTIEGLLAKA